MNQARLDITSPKMLRNKDKSKLESQNSTPSNTSPKMATRSSLKQDPRPPDLDQKSLKQKTEAGRGGRTASSLLSSGKRSSERMSLMHTFIQSQSQSERSQIEQEKDVNNGSESQNSGNMSPSANEIASQLLVEGHFPKLPIPPPPPLDPIDVKGDISMVVKAINSLQTTMIENHNRLELKLDTKLSHIDDQMSNLNTRLQRQEEAFSRLSDSMVDKTRFHGLENASSNVACQADKQFADIRNDVSEMRSAMMHLKTENTRLNHRLIPAEEQISVFGIRAKKLNFSVDGLAESDKKNENLKSVLVEKVNTQAKVKISQSDITTAYRVGKYDKDAKYPRTVYITVKNDQVRNTLLKCRSKLPVTEEEKAIFLNEDLPPSYRQRKSMLRDLIKVAKEKKIPAKIDKGGIKVDGKYFGPDSFSKLPEEIRPQNMLYVPNKQQMAAWPLPPNGHHYPTCTHADSFIKTCCLKALNNAFNTRKQLVTRMTFQQIKSLHSPMHMIARNLEIPLLYQRNVKIHKMTR